MHKLYSHPVQSGYKWKTPVLSLYLYCQWIIDRNFLSYLGEYDGILFPNGSDYFYALHFNLFSTGEKNSQDLTKIAILTHLKSR